MDKNNVGIIAGSFSPPHKGHFNIVKKAINEIDNCSKFIISVASGTRDGITQDDSYNIWNIYIKYLPSFVEIVKGKNIKDVYDYSKEHLDENIYFVLGYREDNEDDLKDFEKRTKSVGEKYPNIQILKITTGSEDKDISGTYVRSISNDINKLSTLLPSELTQEEIEDIFKLISPKNINEGLNNEVPYDYKHHIVGLTKYAIDKGMNVRPVPKVIFKNNEEKNSKDFLGKTAYYDPTNNSIVLFTLGRDPIAIEEDFCAMLMKHINHLDKMKELENVISDVTEFMSSQGYTTSIPPKIKYIHDDPHNDSQDIIHIKSAYYNPSNKEIVLYTKNRHPRDIVSSYCHEYIHMVQDEEGRLNNISGENVLDSKELEEIEREAYENGGFMFRSFKDFMKK